MDRIAFIHVCGTNRHMPQRLSRNVSLTPELDRYLVSKVESGAYITISEVVRVALRLLQEKELPSSAKVIASAEACR